MSLNPILFAEEVNRQNFRYQLTAFPLSDPELARQAKEMLGAKTYDKELVKGPYVSLSRPFAEGDLLEDLAKEGNLHPAVAGIAEHPRMFAHQQDVFNAVKKGHHCLVSTGTGSGKTESFFYPIFDHCFRLRDAGAPPGIVAILVYPMNALATDQLERLRFLLAGTGITFGMYIGTTPRNEAQITNIERMKEGEGREHIPRYREKLRHHENISISPSEEKITIEEMRAEPPRILLTNVNQLEYLLTRAKDLVMFENAPIQFLVFDEAHTYTGSRGAEVALLIRRLRTFCNRSADDVICIGTSATIVDPTSGTEASRRFAHRFFGVDPEKVVPVQEKYGTMNWSSNPIKTTPLGEGSQHIFESALNAIDGEVDVQGLSAVLRRLSLPEIYDADNWREELYRSLLQSETAREIHNVLDHPMELMDATHMVWKVLRRRFMGQENVFELLLYLTLGATAIQDDYPLLRPQLHYFIRGLAGVAAVLVDSIDEETPAKIYFSHQKAIESNPDPRLHPSAVFPVVSCKKCGQHYFELWTEDIDDEEGLNGGNAEKSNVYWSLSAEGEGTKITFTNRFVSEIDGEEDLSTRLDRKRESAYICRFCGTIHINPSDECLNPKCHVHHPLVPVYVLQQHGSLKSCPACLYRESREERSALRPLSAVSVADIHILAQSMLNAQSSENKKLIIFADNRQEAAFQSAWMIDHARRYRLRHLIYNIIKDSGHPLSIGDLVDSLNKKFIQEKDLARAIASEVFASSVEESFSSKTEDWMKKYLRIAILRELTTSFAQRDSLETWGKIRVEYFGISCGDPTIKELADKYGMTPEETTGIVTSLLDVYRRGQYFYDQQEPIFSHYWNTGSWEVQRKFIPYFDYPPKGLKLQLEKGDKRAYIVGLISGRGKTSAESFLERVGFEDNETVHLFIKDLWEAMVDEWKILVPVELKDAKNKSLAGASGTFQVDSTKIGLVAQNERYRCKVCNRVHTRETPKNACTRIHCFGTLQREKPPEDDYNVSLLDRDFTMLIPREHTAQVPPGERQNIESEFKEQKGRINCLVATPTLELGIDIGALDMVLMRNVPPLPSNYWQRAGRAGRRHRMAVIYTYCMKKPHDEYFFEDPMRLLDGKIHPPHINLKNPVMINKHVHASVLTELTKLAYPPFKAPTIDDESIVAQEVLNKCVPPFISGYLFEEGNRYREKIPDLSSLETLISDQKSFIEEKIRTIFSEYWPIDSSDEVLQNVLESYIDSMTEDLKEHVNLIHQRLSWAIYTRNRLTAKEREVTILDEMEQRLLIRCRNYIKELQQEKLDNYTLNVLATRGFLPGYAMHQGSVTGFAQNDAYSSEWRKIAFELPRPNALALREFVPGNLLYANGGKYKSAWYHLPFGERRVEPDKYLVDVNVGRASETERTLNGYAEDTLSSILGVQISDTELGFVSLVSDEEANRFRLPVTIMGLLRTNHRGVDNYRVADREFSHHHGQSVRLLNVGPSDRVKSGELGYPLCIVCGASRSPYASGMELEKFKEFHKKNCGKKPENYCFTADALVDGLLFTNIETKADAVNLAEGLIAAANISLEMEPDDLQILLLADSQDIYDVFLYDPMPGGSGIIDQMIEKWEEIIERGIKSLVNCSNQCETSCYECLKSYRNMQYHDSLNRHRALELLEEIKAPVTCLGKIQPVIEETESEGDQTNIAEMRLSKKLKEYGFPPFEQQKRIELPQANTFSIPDFYYESADRNVKIAIYLDGLSKRIHGDENTYAKDQFIRMLVRSKGIAVVEIPASALDDQTMLDAFLSFIAQILNDKEILAKPEIITQIKN